MQTTYRPGQWSILVAPGALIALSPDAPDELITRLWERERPVGELAAVIDALTEQASGSFAAMLPFAAVVMEGPNARIAVRGDATVAVTGPEGHETFNGSNVTTWSERFVANASRIAITAGDADAGAELPITGGVVRAASVRADIEPADTVVEEPEAAEPEKSDAEALDPVVSVPLVEETPEESEPVEASMPAEESESVEESESIGDPESLEEPEPIEEPEPELVEDPAPAEDLAEPATEEIPELPTADEDVVEGATLVPSEATYSSDSDEFDQLFGATIATAGAVAPPPAPPAPPAPVDGDHDGATISVAEARALRQNVPAAEPDAPTAVLPVVAESAGRVRVSTGQVVTLDRTVIIGRRPRSTRASGADLPHLIAVESPQQDISRSHLEIRPEGDTVVVVDLHTTNGSTLLRSGSDPLRLHPGEQTLVLSDDVVDLGDGVTVVFEDLP